MSAPDSGVIDRASQIFSRGDIGYDGRIDFVDGNRARYSDRGFARIGAAEIESTRAAPSTREIVIDSPDINLVDVRSFDRR